MSLEHSLHQEHPHKALVRSKPYISTKSATINAENDPKALQSLLVCGLKKLAAKKRKIKELTAARPQRP